jgi:EAL domain-containing protein (putative c-di-GMP-specific phosphodiesterase class I)
MEGNLSLQVIAEISITSAQLSFLSSFACEEAQGYSFSRPISSTQIEANF